MSTPLNIAETLRETARRFPDVAAVVVPGGYRAGRRQYATTTFAELDARADALARGLIEAGVNPGRRIVLMVRPGVDFIALVYAVFRAAGVLVLIDPGMGPRHVFHCLDQVEPDGFIAIPPVHAVRVLSRRFPSARLNVTAGRRWFWGGTTLDQVRQRGEQSAAPLPRTLASDPAAIIFTSGSTGPAKGVLFEHGMFAAQVEQIRDRFHIQPGGVDLPGFPLFGLFNAAMGVTTVIPDMNPSKPASVDPRKIREAVLDQTVTQAFGSPAIWNKVSRWCVESGETLPSIRRILTAGAPVPPAVLGRLLPLLDRAGEIHTPYGATEALPVASIEAREVLHDTAALTQAGRGTCVGTPFEKVRVRIIARVDGPIPEITAARELPVGEIGEIIVSGPQVTREYFRRPDGTALAKIADGETFWHRMGDVGYFDERGRLWFCGRKGHIVDTEQGPLYTECVEPMFNTLPGVFRSALVGVGPRPRQTPVLIVEPETNPDTRDRRNRDAWRTELLAFAAANPQLASIRTVLFHPSLPVDVRHNAKINREALAVLAAKRVVT
jgi:acyl-CoA synthetase (AMP-forming)/AMP-acid ligase II